MKLFSRGFVIALFGCLSFFGICVYSYLDMQNKVTSLRIAIPKQTQNLKRIQEENTRLQLAISEFESPQNLLQIARQKAFSHLKFPTMKEVVTVTGGVQLKSGEALVHTPVLARSSVTVAMKP